MESKVIGYVSTFADLLLGLSFVMGASLDLLSDFSGANMAFSVLFLIFGWGFLEGSTYLLLSGAYSNKRYAYWQFFWIVTIDFQEDIGKRLAISKLVGSFVLYTAEVVHLTTKITLESLKLLAL